MELQEMMDKGEKPVEVVHQHWMGLMPIGIASLATIGLSLFGIYALGRYESGVSVQTQSAALLGLGALFLLGVILSFAGYQVYRGNRLIISNRNVYMASQSGLLKRKVAQLNLEQVEDVAATQHGIWASLFNYGDVTIATAAEEENFKFIYTPKPRVVAAHINHLHNQVVSEDNKN